MEAQLPFIGMARELERLSLAFAAGDPLLLLGPQGSGKTRLIREALPQNRHVLYIAWEPTLHALLISMARALLADPEDWLAAQTSVRLKGLLWTAVESSPKPMMLDGVTGAGFPTYRFLQRIYHTRGMALFAASRDAFSLGALARLFWNPANVLHVPPLQERDCSKPPPIVSSCVISISMNSVRRYWRAPTEIQGKSSRCAAWRPSPNTIRAAISSSRQSASIP